MYRQTKILFKSSQRIICTLFLTLLLLPTKGWEQELFPLSEPASTLPKNTLGIRLFSETYKEVYQWRNMSYLRLEYGVTPKLSMYCSLIASNHHGEKFPIEFPFHNTPERGKFYPYGFSGIWLYGKYRFLSIDAAKSHFRISAFAEGSYAPTTHHESEPNLEEGDNSGVGFGLITTALKNQFAVSVTAGAILPFMSRGVAPDPVPTLPDIREKVYYGKAFMYRISFGYRLLPVHYKNFNQGNLNLYAEFRGRVFGPAKVKVNAGTPDEYYLKNKQYPIALQSGAFIDFSPGLQYIYKSNLRFDFSVTFRWLGFSFTKLYPIYSVGIQRYFYF